MHQPRASEAKMKNAQRLFAVGWLPVLYAALFIVKYLSDFFRPWQITFSR